jgi:hypothetical protein
MKTVTASACFLHAQSAILIYRRETISIATHKCSAQVTCVLICSADGDSRSTNHLIKIHQTLKLSRKPKFENLCSVASIITSVFVKISPNYSSWEVQMQEYLMIHLRFLTLLKLESNSWNICRCWHLTSGRSNRYSLKMITRVIGFAAVSSFLVHRHCRMLQCQ